MQSNAGRFYRHSCRHFCRQFVDMPKLSLYLPAYFLQGAFMSNPNEPTRDSFDRQFPDRVSAPRSNGEYAGEQTGQQSRGCAHNIQNPIEINNLTRNTSRTNPLTSQELQLLLLTLLVDKPAHGYELINSLATLSSGCCSPSPGIIYPCLTYLGELGHIAEAMLGKRKGYELSDAGRQFLIYHQERVDLTWLKLINLKRKSHHIGNAYADTCETDDEVALGLDVVSTYLPELIRARHALRNALAQRTYASAEEQSRIVEILLQAARDILKK